MRVSFFLLLFVFLSWVSVASAGAYYSDMVFDVGPTGTTFLSGRTNHPMLQVNLSDALTSKKGDVWTFNLSVPSEDVFSDFVYVVNLPAGASVSYVKASGHYRLSSEDDVISISGFGENETLSILVQYQLKADYIEVTSTTEPYEVSGGGDYSNLLVLLGVFIAFVLLLLVVRAYKGDKGDLAGTGIENIAATKDDIDSVLSDRQKDIMRVLRDEGKPINQSLICERLNLPKSSVSRNVDSLERMGYVSKTRNGMSTMISLSDKGA